MANLKGLVAGENYQTAERYMEKLEETMETLDYQFATGNPVTDVVINDKYRKGKALGIDFQVQFCYEAGDGISVFDMGILLNNLLDNAMEACLAGKGKDALRERMAGKAPLNEDDPGENAGERPPFIRIYIGVLKDQLYISVANSSFGKISKIGRRYLSTKESKGHGYGLMRIDRIGERYHGYLNRQNEEGAFVTEVMLPLG